MLNDPLAIMMSNILNAEKVGKAFCVVKPVSSMIRNVLGIMNTHGYVGDFSDVQDGRGDFLRLNLLGKVNNCGVIKPRFSAKNDNFEKFEKRFLPAANFGFIIVSTPQGLMTHDEAKQKKLGGNSSVLCTKP